VKFKTFSGEVVQDKVNLLVFLADWSLTSSYLKRKLERTDLRDFEVFLIDATENWDLMQRYNVAVIPTLIAIYNGEIVGILEGHVQDRQFSQFISKLGRFKSVSEEV